ncbi:sulfite exporter TauE/SafE family protein [Marinoscillum sp. MHG1-6]|uniref:sulfite exporter TauE/SafE family protein n=1 Tax=Marinoscillum sp. MHG1-6 TaxID=2959627 RepID=UPI0021576DA1|nr:sulfite exporter TauE/SafE family protein [Marinoscillum sp. MHG1-6]
MEPIGYIASFGIGLILGLTGGGGSLLSLPILVYLFSVGVIEATSYSLFIVGITSLIGAAHRYSSAMISLYLVGIFGVPSIIAVFITRVWIIPTLPEEIFQIGAFHFNQRQLILSCYGILVIIASIFMITHRESRFFQKSFTNNHQPIRLILFGILTGFITGFIGLGGGFMIVPLLMLIANAPFKTAVGTTLLIIAAKSLVGFIGDLNIYVIDWFLILSVSAVSVLGILLGNKFSTQISVQLLKTAFGWFILIMGSSVLLFELIIKGTS